jgi:DNA-binding CsgD family transcriptional regulator
MQVLTSLLSEQDGLTDIERAILAKLCAGLTFSQIDIALSLEIGTARRTRKSLFRRIGARTRHEASAAILPTNQFTQRELKELLVERYHLARRECEVVVLLFRCPELQRRHIAEALEIKENTVRCTINRVNKKLGVRTRAEACSKIYHDLTSE